MDLIEIENRGKKSVYYCRDCNKTVKTTKKAVEEKGSKPCACGNFYYRSSHRRLFKVLSHCKENNLSLLDVQDPDKGRRNSFFTVKSNSCGHTYRYSWKNLITDGYGCPYCSGRKKPTREEVTEQLSKICDERGLDFSFVGEGHKTTDDIKVSCKLCERESIVPIAYLKYDNYKCSCCVIRGYKRDQPSNFYIMEMSCNFTDEKFIKVGFSYYIPHRLANLRFNNKNHTVSKVYSWAGIAEDCRKFEQFCLSNFTKKSTTLVDGKTECLYLEDITSVVSYAEEYFQTEGKDSWIC